MPDFKVPTTATCVILRIRAMYDAAAAEDAAVLARFHIIYAVTLYLIG